MPEFGDRLQHEQLRRDLGLAGRTPRAACPAPASRSGSPRCTGRTPARASASCASSGVSSHALEVQDDAMRIPSVDNLVRRRRPALRGRRACIPAPATCAPTRCARRWPRPRRARRAAPPAAAATGRARRRSSDIASRRARACRRRSSRSDIAHRPPCARRARARVPALDGIARMRECHREVRRRQQSGRPARAIRSGKPRRRRKQSAKPCRFPFARIGEPIKIKVIEV